MFSGPNGLGRVFFGPCDPGASVLWSEYHLSECSLVWVSFWLSVLWCQEVPGQQFHKTSGTCYESSVCHWYEHGNVFPGSVTRIMQVILPMQWINPCIHLYPFVSLEQTLEYLTLKVMEGYSVELLRWLTDWQQKSLNIDCCRVFFFFWSWDNCVYFINRNRMHRPWSWRLHIPGWCLWNSCWSDVSGALQRLTVIQRFCIGTKDYRLVYCRGSA